MGVTLVRLDEGAQLVAFDRIKENMSPDEKDHDVNGENQKAVQEELPLLREMQFCSQNRSTEESDSSDTKTEE